MQIDKVHNFCLEVTIPGILKAVENDNVSNALNAVINRASLDVMAGARYLKGGYVDNQDYYKKELKRLIMDGKTELSSEVLIDKLCRNRNKHRVNVGSIQKLVNMTLKYLYVIQEHGLMNEYALKVELKNCDCPLDSRILEELRKREKKKYTPWTKLDSLDEYKTIQDDITKYVKESNLEFDFDNWKK
ncbi:MAG: hypothetical protein J5876_03460 [Lachnospiraceae bacterium]|nr:hypothetical protein [Lachnospiraceae bacterium]MBO4461370.1 hypothetical protein [Lachnospiraceae bacterium]